jgi:SAM-dependent methyltransferase
VIDGLTFPAGARVYELSSTGALFAYLRRRWPDLYFSEYYGDVPPGERKNGIPCQDIRCLRLPDASFDLVTSTEVFEHVPDDRRGFSEVYRVLKPGGYKVFSVPLSMEGRTRERAVLESGGVKHLLEPEYHSDRIRGRGTVLAYRTYGSDIVDRLRDAGFTPEFRMVNSDRHRIRSQYVVVARKPPEAGREW